MSSNLVMRENTKFRKVRVDFDCSVLNLQFKLSKEKRCSLCKRKGTVDEMRKLR
jgi:hypothetical protein